MIHELLQRSAKQPIIIAANKYIYLNVYVTVHCCISLEKYWLILSLG